MQRFRANFSEHHPALVPDIDAVIAATEDFRDWLIANQAHMAAPAGIGKENYSWWMKNVHLIPYTWDQILTMAQSDYDRAITFLKLEENRNRDEPDFHLSSSAQENIRRQEEAVAKLIRFLRREDLLTLPQATARTTSSGAA